MYSGKYTDNLNVELFQNPTNEYRGAPLWSWNNKLNKETLLRHMDYFHEMGFGGFHIHCRTGLDTPYMGEEFMDCVHACVYKAKKEGMYAYLYDEDRWPSGTAGGKVTEDEKYRSRYLVFTSVSNEDRQKGSFIFESTGKAVAQGNGRLLARYDITIKDGYLYDYHRLEEGGGGNVWYLYEEIAGDNPWYNGTSYADTLNRMAVGRFIEETHEKYLACVGEEFGETIPSIFTDEPQFVHKTTLSFADAKEDVILPYTELLTSVYKETYGADFFDTVPELIWELSGGMTSVHRYRYHDMAAELFSSSFADVTGKWCKDHNIILTGHMMGEETLLSQTNTLGEVMRSFRGFQLPGIDMLCDAREYTTAKQAQSASHQFGCHGVMSELYGVTNWDFDFRGHKLAGDWQAALGVTLRVHHLSWESMNGEAKRDYPASIFYQSPWYQEYRFIEDHFARLNTALTRGMPYVRIGVIHPIESYWLHYGPREQTAMIREEMEDRFQSLTEWLLFSQLDFDFISESLLPQLYKKAEDRKFHVGKMLYDVIIIPCCETLRSATISYLSEYQNTGGRIIFLGAAPGLVDAMPSDAGYVLYSGACKVDFSKSKILTALNDYREIEIRSIDGSMTDNMLYQLRQDGDNRWLFIANGKKPLCKDIPEEENLTIQIKGDWQAQEYDTMNGEITVVNTINREGKTIVKKTTYDHTSILLKLMPYKTANRQRSVIEEKKEAACYTQQEGYRLCDISSYQLTEPNVLLLDMAEYRFDKGEWHAREEILRLDNNCRKKAGYPLRMEAFAQPWTRVKTHAEHVVDMRFTIDSEVRISDTMLALEELSATTVFLNGTKVGVEDCGYFTDECIRRILLPEIPAGKSELCLKVDYSKDVNLEWCYLLGDFGVKVQGSKAYLTQKPEWIAFGDYSCQGFPFYGGNMIYDVQIIIREDGEYILAVEKFRSPLIGVKIDGCYAGKIAIAPYQVSLGYLKKGEHIITLISYGNRVNTFGTIHAGNEENVWIGPDAWRTEGAYYSYEYQLKRMGILAAPRVFKCSDTAVYHKNPDE